MLRAKCAFGKDEWEWVIQHLTLQAKSLEQRKSLSYTRPGGGQPSGRWRLFLYDHRVKECCPKPGLTDMADSCRFHVAKPSLSRDRRSKGTRLVRADIICFRHSQEVKSMIPCSHVVMNKTILTQNVWLIRKSCWLHIKGYSLDLG